MQTLDRCKLASGVMSLFCRSRLHMSAVPLRTSTCKSSCQSHYSLQAEARCFVEVSYGVSLMLVEASEQLALAPGILHRMARESYHSQQ